ncbi:MAG: S41 family peptidase [Planctomycetes bacterium]|nr:S41 family peptidase [Planctomycetota bacterium]
MFRQNAFKLARTGKFQQALKTFGDAQRADPNDSVSIQAASLITAYLERMAKAAAERQAESDMAVARVKRAMMAQASLPELAKAGIEKDLRKKVFDGVVPAYQKIGTVLTLEDAGPKRVGELKKQSLAAIEDCLKNLKEALALAKNGPADYAAAFASVGAAMEKYILEEKQFWQDMDASGPDVIAVLKKLRTIEDGLGDAVDDIGALISEMPWRSAIAQSRMARELVSDKDQVAKSDWYKNLLSFVEEQGKQAFGKEKWYDALAAFANLSDLEPGNEKYQEEMLRAERRVRAIRLYGREPASKPATAAENDENTEPPWQQLVAGVDAALVKKIITKLSENYVSAVDFRKLIRGGLLSIQALAETPQAANSFSDLGDKDKKAAFLKAINDELTNIQKKDNVDHLYAQLVLNSILDASDSSVKIPVDLLAMEFADGMVGQLDRFSSIVWPNDMADFQKGIMGHFCGIGVQISKEPDQPLKVVSPLEGTPAFNAGIKTGDLILAVDGKATEKLSTDDLVKKIMGPKDTDVLLKIQRRGIDEPFDVRVKRDEIVIRTVKGWQRLSGGDWDYMVDPTGKIGYIRLTQFTSESHEDCVKAMKQLSAKGVKSFILDLRHDPGGLLRSAVEIADEFLDSGRIVSTQGRQGEISASDAHSGGECLNGTIILLVNQYSASASEILAGAVKDWQRGLIIGQRTFGKGSVQNIIPIGKPLMGGDPRAILKLTTAYYYLPSGRCLHRKNGEKEWGVDPDVDVFMTPRQARRWLEIRRKTDLLQEVDKRRLADDLTEQFDEDVQLRAAVLLARLLALENGSAKQTAVK